jgi:succinoglycan biosynthesis transport protein ExoP
MAIDRTASTFVSTASAPAEAPFGFADFLRVLDERRSLIRNITLAVCALTLLVLLYLPTLYSSSAVVMLDQRKNNVADLSSVLSALPTDPSSVQNQIQVLSSRDLAGRVIGKLKLYDDPEFNPALNKNGTPDIGDFVRLFNPANWGPARQAGNADYERDAIVGAFLDRLDVSALGLSTSITVTFASRDPAKAALIANTLADTYTEDQVDTKVAAARKATQWLTDRMHQLAQQVQAGEGAIAQYKAAHNLVDSAQGNSLVDQQLVAINALLIAAQSDLAEKKANYDRVQALVRSGNTADVSQVVASPLIVQLRSQEGYLVRQEADLTARYGPNHPKMIAIRTQKRDLESKVAQEAARVADSIASDLAVARAHVGSIEASLARVEKQAAGDDISRIKLNALEANLASTRTMYESFVTRLRATQDQDDIQNPESRVISRAPIPTAPSSPHRVLFFAASIPAGLLLGVLVALLAERLQTPLPRRAPRPFVERTVPVMAQAPLALPPILGELPATLDMRAADFVVDNPGAPYSRALSAVLSRMTPGRSGRGRIVALTAPGSDVGKSVIALGLTRVAAAQGLRTVLLDGDFNRPAIAAAAGFQAVPAGIVELLNGLAPLSRALSRDPRSAALLLSAVRPSGTPQALWALPKMAELLSYFRQNCDLVIIAAAPALTDMPYLARLCDQVILVAPGRAPRTVLDGAVRALAAYGAPQPGLVVTR